MDFEFSAEQESLRATVARFLAKEAPISPYVRDLLGDAPGTSKSVWLGLAELGALGLLIPEPFGGLGLGMVDVGVVLEEMGRLVHPGPFLSSAVGAVTAIVAAGGTADQRRYLPSLADGTSVGTIALLDDGARRLSAASTVMARRDGDGWRLSGVKAPVADVLAADLLVVSAHDGAVTGLYVVEAAAPGVTTSALPTVDGTRQWGRLALDGAPACRLGGGDAGAGAGEAIGRVLDTILVAMVTDAVGAAEAALAMAVDYAKEREQFGKPIGSFQAVQHLCTDMLQAVEQARAGAYYALWACDAAPSSERHRAAVMAKAFASDALAGVGASAIQVLGGVGFTWEHDMHLYYKRLLTLQHAYGGTSEQLEELATIVL
jgi:acyl-CoA dehydrogenase